MKQDRSLLKKFIRYAIPAVAAQWVYTLYTMVDAIFVARWEGAEAVSAVDLCFPYLSILFALSMTLAVGSSAVCSIYMGEGRDELAKERFTQNVVFNFALGIVMLIVTFLFMDQVCALLGYPNDTVLQYMKQYISRIAPFTWAFLLSYSMEILMKADGFPEKSTAIVILGVFMNIALDYLLVCVMHKGTAGAAFATSITQFSLNFIYFHHFIFKSKRFRFVRFHFNLRDQLRMFADGIAAGISEFSSGFVTFTFNRAVLMYLPADRIITYTIADYIDAIAVLSCNGIAQGVQPLISFAYGAKDKLEQKKLFKYLIVSSILFGIVCFICNSIILRPFSWLFIGDGNQSLMDYSVWAVGIFQLNLLLCGFNLAISGYFAAIEKAFSAAVISFARTLLIATAILIIVPIFGGC